MTAFYFRQNDKPLFGFYHAPESSPSRAVGVVLCSPQGHEYIRCHRALRILSDLLAHSGFPSLRFDYYGCGDSAGDFADSDLEQWRQDVSTAVQECRVRSGRDRIAAVGIRLGASLALLSTDGQAALDSLVLWDPVFHGGQYLRELESLHLERQSLWHQGAPAGRRAGQPTEFLGFSYSSRLLDQLAALGFGRVSLPDVGRILLLETTGPDESAPPSAPHGALAGRVDHVAVPGPKIWQERSARELYGALVPRAALETIVHWLADVYAGEYIGGCP